MRKKPRHKFGPFTRYVWFYKSTREGKLLWGGILISISIANSSLMVPVYHLLCALCGLAAIAFFAGFVLRPKLRLDGDFPDKAIAGQPVTGEFRIRNLGKWPAFDLAAGYFSILGPIRQQDIQRTLPVLGVDETNTVPVTLKPLRRGLYPLPKLSLFSTFPFNLYRTKVRLRGNSATDHGRALMVLPSFHRVSEIDVPVSAKYQPGGIALSSNVGESPEYIGNREFQPGDTLRHIDHRAWARLGTPVVREYQEEYYCRVALVLDTYVPRFRVPKPSGFPDLEAAISLSASIADALSNGEYVIDIFAAGPKLHVFRAGRHTAHFENVLEILACVDPCRKSPFDVVTPALCDELANISTTICVFLDWDKERQDLVRAAVESGSRVKVYIVRDSKPSRPVEQADGVYGITHYKPSDIMGGGIEVL